MSYEIKVLNNDEFDALPYDGIGDSLGFADVKKGKVFVRHTGSHELNRYLINHEIDHLVEEHATDEDENGIRHKSFGRVIRSIINPINLPGAAGLWTGDSKKGLFFTDNQSSAKAEGNAGIDNAAPSAGGAPSMPGGGAMSQFSAQPGSPDVGASSTQSSLNPGQLSGGINGQSQSISPEILQRIYGYYSGRASF